MAKIQRIGNSKNYYSKIMKITALKLKIALYFANNHTTDTDNIHTWRHITNTAYGSHNTKNICQVRICCYWLCWLGEKSHKNNNMFLGDLNLQLFFFYNTEIHELIALKTVKFAHLHPRYANSNKVHNLHTKHITQTR